MNQNRVVDADIVEKKLLNYCMQKTKEKKFCEVCLIREYCFAFLEVTTCLDLALDRILTGIEPPPFIDFILTLRESKK